MNGRFPSEAIPLDIDGPKLDHAASVRIGWKTYAEILQCLLLGRVCERAHACEAGRACRMPALSSIRSPASFHAGLQGLRAAIVELLPILSSFLILPGKYKLCCAKKTSSAYTITILPKED